MASKKSTKTENVAVVTDAEGGITVEEVVAPVEVEGVEPETVEEAVAETIKNPMVIAKSSTPMRKVPSLESKYIVGYMTVGVAYEIIGETTSKIYGDFYQLENGYYITKNGNYTIS